MRRIPDAESAVRQLAMRQAGVFTRAQARELGLSSDAVRLRIRRGELAAFRGVLRLDGWPDDDAARTWAAVLRGGPGTVLTGTSGLRLLGADCFAAVPTVVLPPGRHQTVPGACVLRETVDPSEVVRRAGIVVRRRPLAVLDGLRTLPTQVASDLIDRALLLRWCEVADVDGWLTRNAGRRGARQVREIRAQVGAGAASHAERLAHRILRDGGVDGWRANVAVHDATGLIGIVDIAFDRLRIAIEIDGRAHHSAADRFQRDRTRQNRLTLAGWVVLRFTWEDLVVRPHLVLTTVRQAVAARRAAAG